MSDKIKVVDPSQLDVKPIEISLPQKPIGMPEMAASNLAAKASYVLGDELEKDYFVIRDELINNGTSQAIQDILSVGESFEQEAMREATMAEVTRTDLDVEQRAAVLQASSDIQNNQQAKDVDIIFNQEAALDSPRLDSDGDAILASRFKSAEQYDEKQNIQNIIDEIKLTAVGDTLKNRAGTSENPSNQGLKEGLWLGLDALEMSVPRYIAHRYQGLYEHMTGFNLDTAFDGDGDAIGDFETLWVGELVHQLKSQFSNLDDEGKVQWATKMADWFRQNPGFIQDANGLETMTTLDSLLDTNFKPGESFDLDRLIENVVSGFDLVGLGWAAKWPLKMFAKMGNFNPDVAAKLAAGTLISSDAVQAEKVLGVTQQEIIRNAIMPSVASEVLTSAPANIVETINKTLRLAETTLAENLLMRPTDDHMIKLLVDQYGQGKLHVNKIHNLGVTDAATNTYKFQAVIGQKGDRGFATAKGALRSAKIRGIEDTGLVVRTTDGKMRTYKTVASAEKNLGKLKADKDIDAVEFYYSFTREESIPPTNIFNMTPENRFIRVLSPAGKFGRRMVNDAVAIFGKSGAKMQAITDRQSRIKNQVDSLILDFSRMTKENQEGALRLARWGSQKVDDTQHGRVISYEEARIAGYSDKQYLGYQQLRIASDFAYNVKNARLKEGLENASFRLVQAGNKNNPINYYGRDVSVEHVRDNKIAQVFDSATQKPVEVTSEMLRDMEMGRGHIMKMKTKVSQGDSDLNYIYVAKGQERRIKDVPNHPLPYLQGHIYVNHNSTWFIEKIGKEGKRFVDGVEKVVKGDRIVVGAGRDLKEARDLMKSNGLSKEELDAGWQLDIREARELSDTSTLDDIVESANQTGELHMGTRGALADTVNGPNANLASMLDNVQKELGDVSHMLEYQAVIKDYRKNWSGYFKQFLPEGRDYPLSMDDLTATGLSRKERALLEDARTAYEYIEFLASAQDPLTRGYKASTLRIAQDIEEGLLGLVEATSNKRLQIPLKGAAMLAGKAAERASKIKKDPIDFLRGAIFQMFLVANVPRQLIVQSSQHLMLAPLEPRYVMSGELYSDATSLVLGIADHGTKRFETTAAGYAQAMGVTVEEYVGMVEGMLRSGLLDAVDSHSFLGGLMLDNASLAGRGHIGTAVGRMGNVGRMAMKGARALGFNAGEKANLITSYLIQARRRKNNGIGHDELVDGLNIYEETRTMTFSMSRGGELGLQRGWFKGLTQFASFQLKAMNAVLGRNPMFSGVDRAKIATVQFLQLGAAGFGIDQLVRSMINDAETESGVAMNPRLEEMLTNGLFNVFINDTLTQMSEDKEISTKLDLRPLGPLSGATYGPNLLISLAFDTNQSVLTTLLGPGSSALERANDGYNAAAHILGKRVPLEGETDVDRTLRASTAFIEHLLPSVSNWFKGQAWKRSGYITSSQGDPIARASYAEAMAKGLFGFNSLKQEKAYLLGKDLKELDREYKDNAKIIVAEMQKVFDRNKGEEFSFLMDSLAQISSIIHTLEPEHWDGMSAAIGNEITRISNIRQRNGQDNIVSTLLGKANKDLIGLKNDMLSIASTDAERKQIEALFEALEIEADMKTNIMEK